MLCQIGVLEVSVGLGAFMALLTVYGWWLKSFIAGAIKHENDKKLELFKGERLRKEKAAVVAEFFAEWTHVRDGDTKRLNQLLWELSIYLPSDLVVELNLLSKGSPNAKSAPELIVAARDYLMGGQDPVDAKAIAHFNHPDNKSMVSGGVAR